MADCNQQNEKDGSGISAKDALRCWEVAVEQANQVGKRRSEVNVFFISIMSLLFTGEFLGLGAFSDKINIKYMVVVMSVFGVLICLIWILQIFAFSSRTGVKYGIIRKLEHEFNGYVYRAEFNSFYSKPYRKCEVNDSVETEREDSSIDETERRGNKWRGFFIRELGIPICFIMLFSALFAGICFDWIVMDDVVSHIPDKAHGCFAK